MKNFMVRFVACFIPNKDARHAFRNKHQKKTLKDRIRDLDRKINSLNDIINGMRDNILNTERFDTLNNNINGSRDVVQNGINQQNAILGEVQYIKNFLVNTTDITKIPPANGFLGLIQNSSLAVLKRFDKIAKKHNIEYWIGFGTLLGAVRHGGFVPWDDDIDICMLRSEYDKLVDILNNEFVDDGFHFSRGEIIRLFYKHTPAQVDIFPFDQGWQSEKLNGLEEQDFIDKLYKINGSVKYEWFPNLEEQKPVIPEQELERVIAQRDSILMNGKKTISKGFCFLAAEAAFGTRNLFSYNEIFPLKRVKFCDTEAFIPNDVYIYLTKTYGDFMSFPNDVYPKHNDMLKRLNQESIQDMLKLTEQK